jgi:hypothetical protein
MHGRPEHYEIAVLTALYCRRVILIETDTAHRRPGSRCSAPTACRCSTSPHRPASCIRRGRHRLGLVVFWLTLLFASFGLFAPHNVISALALTLCALAVSGAVEMILEFEQPFGGPLHISPLPMRQAVDALGQFHPAAILTIRDSSLKCPVSRA